MPEAPRRPGEPSTNKPKPNDPPGPVESGPPAEE